LESNWRQSIVGLGLQQGEYDLVARVLGTPVSIWVTKRHVADGTFDVIRFLTPGSLPVILTTLPIPVDAPHFPYGTPVVPD
jgi:hypothetical protein